MSEGAERASNSSSVSQNALAEPGEGLVVAFVDVDGLKRVNDTEGHLAGDALLIAVADSLRACLRSYDLVMRFGGDEFVCALPSGQRLGTLDQRPDGPEPHRKLHRADRGRPGLLVFEITETALVRREVAARAFAERLHGLGCKLALDDFGTGYGGFTFLKRLPIDYLKIDVEFVSDFASNTASRHVVQAVVALARAFSLQTVGEGVEDEETLTLLRELGVDYAQGYHIARPAPFEPRAIPRAITRGLIERRGRQLSA
jgi:predicted signal transduction protein with EAL and GGDEF domain